jgi:hypothetical protein
MRKLLGEFAMAAAAGLLVLLVTGIADGLRTWLRVAVILVVIAATFLLAHLLGPKREEATKRIRFGNDLKSDSDVSFRKVGIGQTSDTEVGNHISTKGAISFEDVRLGDEKPK